MGEGGFSKALDDAPRRGTRGRVGAGVDGSRLGDIVVARRSRSRRGAKLRVQQCSK
jgi:hypothetical protein